MVYVDNMRTEATVYNRWTGRSVTSQWSHLTADTDAELHAFARKLGLKREYHQPFPKHSRSHYDVTEPRRRLAIALGAIAVRIGYEPWRGLGVKRRQRHEYLVNGDAYADDVRAILPDDYEFPPMPLRERKIEALECGVRFDSDGEPIPE